LPGLIPTVPTYCIFIVGVDFLFYRKTATLRYIQKIIQCPSSYTTWQHRSAHHKIVSKSGLVFFLNYRIAFRFALYDLPFTIFRSVSSFVLTKFLKSLIQ
jgi:hypothetical protein